MATRKTTPSDLDLLKISPEVAWYMESRHIPLPDCPPLFKTPEPRKVRGAKFDPARVDKVLASFNAVRHTQGKWAGKPLKPDPWQVAYIIAPVFGWIAPDPDSGGLVRIIRQLYVELPRKNGKSTLLGGIALYLTGGDGEPGAQVVAAATTKDQAQFVFKPIKDLVERSPLLKPHFKAVGTKVMHPRSGSYMMVISSIADAQHGANLHGGVVDELHVHKSPDMLETIESGTGSRSQPLIAVITTADEGTQDSVYDRRRSKIERLANGVIKEPAQYGVVWAAEPSDDPFIEATWRKANPGYGVSPTRAYLAKAALEAQNTPSELPKFLRLHLGLRRRQVMQWLQISQWDATGQMIDDTEWAGELAHCGLDLSTSTDFTAFTILSSTNMVRLLCWIPEERIEFLEKLCGVPLRRWAAEGWLKVTEGNVVDYAKVRDDILAERDRLGFTIASVGYDPWNASETVQKLEEAGLQMVPVRQGYATLSAPSKAIETQVIGSTPELPLLRTGGNPLLRWMADCVEVRTDDNGNIKPVKPDRVKSSKRIDGIVALIMAKREQMAAGPAEESSAVAWLQAKVAAAASD